MENAVGLLRSSMMLESRELALKSEKVASGSSTVWKAAKAGKDLAMCV